MTWGFRLPRFYGISTVAEMGKTYPLSHGEKLRILEVEASASWRRLAKDHDRARTASAERSPPTGGSAASSRQRPPTPLAVSQNRLGGARRSRGDRIAAEPGLPRRRQRVVRPRPAPALRPPVQHSGRLPRRRNRISSNPKASTIPTLSRSASSRASPHRFTSLDTVCQSQPSSSATPDTVRPRPTCHVAHLAAREVNRARTGATRESCSANDPTPHTASGHSHRRFHHTRSTDRPKQGRSTNRALFQPLLNTPPPPQNQRNPPNSQFPP